MEMYKLFTPVKDGAIDLRNRIVMAPMTGLCVLIILVAALVFFI